MKHSEQINEIATALALAQSQMKVVLKDGTNPAFKSKYSTLANVIDAIRPHLAANGIAFSQGLERPGSEYVMTTALFHKSGQWIVYEFPIVIPELKTSTVGHLMQALGSITTYACRYGLTSACGCAPGDEDDDGESAKQLPINKKPSSEHTVSEFESLKAKLLSVLENVNVAPTGFLEFCRHKAHLQKISGVETMKLFLENPDQFVKDFHVYMNG